MMRVERLFRITPLRHFVDLNQSVAWRSIAPAIHLNCVAAGRQCNQQRGIQTTLSESKGTDGLRGGPEIESVVVAPPLV